MNENFENRLSHFQKVGAGSEAVVYRALLDEKIPVAFRWNLESVSAKNESAKIDDGEVKKFAGMATILGKGILKNRPFSLAEYIVGISSAEASPMPPKIAVKMLRKLCGNLSVMADAEIFHGDLSPENVLIDEKENPVLIDFGSSCVGTPRFISPECLEGNAATEKSEIFSLGALLYFWISGEPLFGGDSLNAIENSIFQVDDYDETLCLRSLGKLPIEIIQKLEPLWKGTLRRDANDRFEDLDELDECLEIAESELSLDDSPLSAQQELIWKNHLALSIREHETGVRHAPEEFLFAATQKSGTCIPTVFKKCFSNVNFFPILGILLFIFILLSFIFFLKTNSPDVETVGKSMLKKTRSLESEESVENDSAVSVRGMMTDADSNSADE